MLFMNFQNFVSNARLTVACKWLYFEVIHNKSTFFREVTFSIFDQRDGEKDDVKMVKTTKYVV